MPQNSRRNEPSLRLRRHSDKAKTNRAWRQIFATIIVLNLFGGAAKEGLGEFGGYGGGLDEEVLRDTDGAWQMG